MEASSGTGNDYISREMITFPEHMNSSTFLVGFAAQSFCFLNSVLSTIVWSF